MKTILIEFGAADHQHPHDFDMSTAAKLRRVVINWRNAVTMEPAELLEQAADELDRERALRSWQPIATAPKDGTAILVWEGCSVLVVHWHSCFEEWVYGSADDDANAATHWMPLPAAPEVG